MSQSFGKEKAAGFPASRYFRQNIPTIAPFDSGVDSGGYIAGVNARRKRSNEIFRQKVVSMKNAFPRMTPREKQILLASTLFLSAPFVMGAKSGVNNEASGGNLIGIEQNLTNCHHDTDPIFGLDLGCFCNQVTASGNVAGRVGADESQCTGQVQNTNVEPSGNTAETNNAFEQNSAGTATNFTQDNQKTLIQCVAIGGADPNDGQCGCYPSYGAVPIKVGCGAIQASGTSWIAEINGNLQTPNNTNTSPVSQQFVNPAPTATLKPLPPPPANAIKVYADGSVEVGKVRVDGSSSQGGGVGGQIMAGLGAAGLGIVALIAALTVAANLAHPAPKDNLPFK